MNGEANADINAHSKNTKYSRKGVGIRTGLPSINNPATPMAMPSCATGMKVLMITNV